MYLFNDFYFQPPLCFKNVRIPYDNANSMLPLIEHLLFAKHVTWFAHLFVPQFYEVAIIFTL